MYQQIYDTTVCNNHDDISRKYQHVGTDSLSTGNIIGRNIESNRGPTGLGRWTLKRFIGQGNAVHYAIFIFS